MIEDRSEGVVFDVKVVPKSSRNWVKVDGGIVKVWVTAVPEKGKANEAVKELLAKKLKVSKSKIKLLSGETSQRKRFLAEGIKSKEELVKKLNKGNG